MSTVSIQLASSRDRLVQWFVLGLYSVVVLVTVPRHESWGDETFAWLLARSHSLGELARTVLRQEGTPGLWHGLLWLLARLHLQFAAAHWVAALFAIGGVWVLVVSSPFPLWLRALLPFTFYLLYQYAVVARQYVMFPLLAFGLTALLCGRRSRPFLTAIVAGLLGNVSLHGFSYAVGTMFAAWLLRDRLPALQWRSGRQEGSGNLASTRWFARVLRFPLGAMATMLAFWLLAVAVAMPLKAAQLHAYGGSVDRPAKGPDAPVVTPAEMPWRFVPPPNMNELQSRVWYASHSPANQVPPRRSAKLLYAALLCLSVVTYPLSRSNFLALLFLGLLVKWLWRQKALVLLLPYLLMLACMLATQVFEHHTGLLFVTLIAVLWTSLRLDPPVGHPTSRALQRGLLAVFTILVLEQISWGAHAVVMDMRHPYTGDDAAIRYLASVSRQKRIGSGTYGVGTGPPAYETHYTEPPPKVPGLDALSPEDADLVTVRAELATRPDIIVQGKVFTGTDSLRNQWTPMWAVGGSEVSLAGPDLVEAAGYHETHRFCGDNFMRAGYSRRLCELIYER